MGENVYVSKNESVCVQFREKGVLLEAPAIDELLKSDVKSLKEGTYRIEHERIKKLTLKGTHKSLRVSPLLSVYYREGVSSTNVKNAERIREFLKENEELQRLLGKGSVRVNNRRIRVGTDNATIVCDVDDFASILNYYKKYYDKIVSGEWKILYEGVAAFEVKKNGIPIKTKNPEHLPEFPFHVQGEWDVIGVEDIGDKTLLTMVNRTGTLLSRIPTTELEEYLCIAKNIENISVDGVRIETRMIDENECVVSGSIGDKSFLVGTKNGEPIYVLESLENKYVRKVREILKQLNATAVTVFDDDMKKIREFAFMF